MIYERHTKVQQLVESKPLPGRYELQIMLDNDLRQTAIDTIEKNKLPFIIEGNSIFDTLSAGELHLKTFITQDAETLQMKDDARKMSKVDYPVLITGETGTGKEIIARSMIGERKGRCVSVNCAAFTETLIESELFGHVKGAFTDASVTKDGLMTAASEGVIFLDEVSTLALSVQPKLLRAIQEKVIRKVGSNKDETITCKIVCASNRNLRKMKLDGAFLPDLYARISTLELDIKPLRERRDDIELITRAFKPGGDRFFDEYGHYMRDGTLDLSENVRSIQNHVIRWNVLGRVVL